MARVLLVDDDPFILATLPLVLREAGHEVEIAPNGREALRVLRLSAFDVVLTDILMPEMDGLELLRAVRREMPGTRVLAMSGGSAHLPGEDTLRMARLLGAHGVLAKPFTAAEATAAIAAALGEGG